MKKKILSLLLVTSMVVSLIGCGAKEEKTSNTTVEETVEEVFESKVGEVAETEESKEEIVPESVAVEITIDNWDEYFELKEVFEIHKNSFDEYTEVHNGFAFCLKEEYLDKYATDSSSKVGFEIQYRWEIQDIALDPKTGEFEYSDDEKDDFIDDPSTYTTEMELQDYRESTSDLYRTFDNDVAAVFTIYFGCGEGKSSRCVEPEVLRAEGTLYFYE